MKNTGLSASSKKIILFLVLAQFFCFKNFSLDFSSNDENPYMEKKIQKNNSFSPFKAQINPSKLIPPQKKLS